MRQTRIALSLLLLTAGILGVYWVATAQEGRVPWPPPPVKFDEAAIEPPSAAPSAPANAGSLPAAPPTKASAADKEKKVGIRKWLAGVMPAAAQESAKGSRPGADGDKGPVQQAESRDAPPPTPPTLTIPAPMPRAIDVDVAPTPVAPAIQPPTNPMPALPVGASPAGPTLLVPDPAPMVPAIKPTMPVTDPTPMDPIKSIITEPVQQIPAPKSAPVAPPASGGAGTLPTNVVPMPFIAAPQPSTAKPDKAKPPAFVLIKSKKVAPTLGPAVPPTNPVLPTPSPIAPPTDLAPAAHQTAAAGDALLGMQTPPLTVEKRFVTPARAGEPLAFQIVVRNLGTVAAQQVQVEDELPADAKVLFTDPPPDLQGNRATWVLNEIPAGGERALNLTLRTGAPGPLTHSTRVSVIATAGKATSLTTIPPVAVAAAAPGALGVQVRAPADVAVGRSAVFEVAYTNQGPQRLTALILRAVLSDGLRHPAGQSIEADIGDLEPGATKTIKVTTSAVQPGRQGVGVRVGSRGGPEATAQATLDVSTTAAGLTIRQAPATRLFVGRTGDVRIELSNRSAKPMRRVAVLAHLPDGAEFIAASDRGNHQPSARSVNWLLDSLAPGETHALLLRVQARTAGQLPLRVDARADGVPETKSTSSLVVDGVADLTLALLGDEALEVGKEAIYEVRVVNPGTSPNTNVRIEVAFAPGLTPRNGQGPSPFRVDGQTVVFEGLPVLVPQGHAVYRIAAVGQAPADARIRVNVTSDQVRTAATRERVTRVYSDK